MKPRTPCDLTEAIRYLRQEAQRHREAANREQQGYPSYRLKVAEEIGRLANAIEKASGGRKWEPGFPPKP